MVIEERLGTWQNFVWPSYTLFILSLAEAGSHASAGREGEGETEREGGGVGGERERVLRCTEQVDAWCQWGSVGCVLAKIIPFLFY